MHTSFARCAGSSRWPVQMSHGALTGGLEAILAVASHFRCGSQGTLRCLEAQEGLGRVSLPAAWQCRSLGFETVLQRQRGAIDRWHRIRGCETCYCRSVKRCPPPPQGAQLTPPSDSTATSLTTPSETSQCTDLPVTPANRSHPAPPKTIPDARPRRATLTQCPHRFHRDGDHAPVRALSVSVRHRLMASVCQNTKYAQLSVHG